jgi:hypothetical protein
LAGSESAAFRLAIRRKTILPHDEYALPKIITPKLLSRPTHCDFAIIATGCAIEGATATSMPGKVTSNLNKRKQD